VSWHGRPRVRNASRSRSWLRGVLPGFIESNCADEAGTSGSSTAWAMIALIVELSHYSSPVRNSTIA
jgi:hypothetical protein